MDLNDCKAIVDVSQETRIQVEMMMAILETIKLVLQQTTQLAQALNEVAAANTPLSRTRTDPGEMSLPANVQNVATGESRPAGCSWWRRSRSRSEEKQVPKEEKGLENTREALMIVATLIATVTFQAALNPPGGFRQDPKGIDRIRPSTFSPSLVDASIHGGSFFPVSAINGDMDSEAFKVFMLANTVGLLASLSIILVLISATSLRGIFLTRLLVIIMWVAILAMGLAFYFGSVICSPHEKFKLVTLLVFGVVIVLLFYGRMVGFMFWSLKKGWGILRGMCTSGSS